MSASLPAMNRLIFHVCRRDAWAKACALGRYDGSCRDRADGFIHFSGFSQVRASVARHHAGEDDLVILTVDPDRLPDRDLKWEPSRSGALFPHLYGSLPVEAVIRADSLCIGDDGSHCFPEHIG